MAKDRFITARGRPLVAWIVIGLLLAAVVGLLATYVLRPGRTAAEDARTAAAIGDMDAAQRTADEQRDERRQASALLN